MRVQQGFHGKGYGTTLANSAPMNGVPYARYFYGDWPEWDKMAPAERNLYYGPTEESVEQELDFAWRKHIHRNKHHWQWWILREDSGEIKSLPMPDRYRREMLADWRGAGMALGYGDNTVEWYKGNKKR